ncbi:MAG: UDP-2,3-diacylglucosamine diphosphatase, partial [Bacteroidetes bacterium]|nr:UDP-2,3-diacylglucosamine diphosphatase [Bacteroidota bacterium]
SIHYFIGNHDMWMYDYFPKELNIPVYRIPIERNIDSKKFYIAHGDGLGPKDMGYKFIKKIFSNKICKWLFAWLHPDLGTRLAIYLSRKSRVANGLTDEVFLGEKSERLIQYVKDIEKTNHHDYYIFGHRHLPLNMVIDNTNYINLGDWVKNYSYTVWDGEKLELKFFKN